MVALVATTFCLAFLCLGCGSPATQRVGTSSTTSAVTVPLPMGSPVAVPGGLQAAALSCGAAGSCLVLDRSGHYEVDDGHGFDAGGTVGPVASGTGTVSLSCPTPSFCAADPGGGDQMVTWNGHGFSAAVALPGANDVEAVGCAASGFCAAVDGVGNSYEFSGGRWQRGAGDWESVAAVSCPSSTFCVSVGGGISQWNGSAWSSPQSGGVSSSFTGVSCPTTTFCMAVDGGGQALTFDGTAWSSPAQVEMMGSADSAGPAFDAVSCPTATFCVAVDDQGAIMEWSGGAWRRQVVDSVAITGVSCPTSTFCAAVDEQGRLVLPRAT